MLHIVNLTKSGYGVLLREDIVNLTKSGYAVLLREAMYICIDMLQVVSLLKYDDVEAGMKVDPSPGYPLVCITVSIDTFCFQKGA